MKVRGRRECKECGHRWSYYDTGDVACPACGSVVSVGVDEERERHTDAPVSLDLTAHRNALSDADDVSALGDDLQSDLRSYVRQRGFIHGGALRDLDDAYLAARELLHAVDIASRARRASDDEQLYLLTLVGGADRGDRPDPDAVPASMREARGLGYAQAVDHYRSDLLTWLDDHPDPDARRALGSLAEHVKRVEALQGDVAPETAEGLVRVARAVGAALRGEGDLAAARERLAELEDAEP
ncbi:MAG: hypothetical protein ABEJ22_09835 [Haloferacaceae archaeon]